MTVTTRARQPLPRGARLLNATARIARRVGVRGPALDGSAARAAACKKTGLGDFGSDEFHEPMDVLVRSLETDAELTPLGRYFARGMVQHALENRLLLQRDWTTQPAILSERIERPLFIIGLPRSGTTILQHLLALDPAHRSLLGWEAASPSPPPERATYDRDPRIAAGERTAKLLDYLAPEARTLHPVGPTLPTECVTLFVNSFASLETTTIHWLPSYLEWCLRAEYGPHYRYYRRQLQLLQYRAPGERWLLKSPAHLFWLDTLLEVFPDACIVMTHRDPVQAVTSYCSLSAVLCGIGSERVDLRAIGATWPRVWAEGLARAACVRDVVGDDRFFDMHYDAFMHDPPGVVEEIYDRFGLAFDTAMIDRMRRHLAAHPAHGGGTHRYTPEQFGLDAAVEHGRFAPYRDRFGVRAENWLDRAGSLR
jgi:hypothetical protein